MKTTFLLRYALLLPLTVFGPRVDVSKVPQPVLEAFQAKFPNQTAAWERENNSSYKAVFGDASHKTSVLYLSDGAWLETDSQISFSAIPQAVLLSWMNGQYGKGKVTDAFILETSGGATQYLITEEMQGGNYTLRYDETGKLLK